eukprot:4297293-Prorocentrum_lima.AAC.1
MVCESCGSSPIHHVWTQAIHRDVSQGFCRECWARHIAHDPVRYAREHLDGATCPDSCPLCGLGEGG